MRWPLEKLDMGSNEEFAKRQHVACITQPTGSGDELYTRRMRHTQRTALFCCRTWPRLLGALMGPPWFSGATHKEPACFAAERGPDPFGHTRALEGPFFDSKPQGQV